MSLISNNLVLFVNGSFAKSLTSLDGATKSQRGNTTLKKKNGGTRMKKTIFILQTLLIVIKLFVLFTTYNRQETGKKNAVPDTEPFQ